MEIEHEQTPQTPEFPEGSSEPSPETPQTPTPPDPRISPEYVTLMEGAMREQNKRIAELEASRAAAPTAPPPPPPKTKEEQRQEFFDDPMGAIQRQLDATIAPLREFVGSVRSTSLVDQLIDRFKADPRFSNKWNPQLENYVRGEAPKMRPDTMTYENLGFVVLAGIGLQATGMLESPRAAPAEPSSRTPETPVPPTPTYMRPSAPPAPATRSDKPTFAALNENEKRLLREYNSRKPKDQQMTEAQFREWQSMPSAAVATTTFDRPEKK